jgi:aryl-alcohol dehydrogenase-like predicted oxidoreductase
MNGAVMEARNLGRSGLRVSAMGLGCNNLAGRLDHDASMRVVHAALDQGITFFDTADVYPLGKSGMSEQYLAEALGNRRKDVVIATKFGSPRQRPAGVVPGSGVQGGGSRRYIMHAVETSLRDLRTDFIDLYQMHRPDPSTPIAETVRALDDLIRQGKVRYVGCSNFPAWRVVDAVRVAEALGAESFVSCQDEYSLLVRYVDPELSPAMQSLGLGMLPYFPLAGGMLTGKYDLALPLPEGTRFTQWPKSMTVRFLAEPNRTMYSELQAFCRDRGRSLLELAISWLLMRPAVSSIIAGASSPDQLSQNIAAAGWKLSPQEMAEIDRITTPALRATSHL